MAKCLLLYRLFRSVSARLSLVKLKSQPGVAKPGLALHTDVVGEALGQAEEEPPGAAADAAGNGSRSSSSGMEGRSWAGSMSRELSMLELNEDWLPAPCVPPVVLLGDNKPSCDCCWGAPWDIARDCAELLLRLPAPTSE